MFDCLNMYTYYDLIKRQIYAVCRMLNRISSISPPLRSWEAPLFHLGWSVLTQLVTGKPNQWRCLGVPFPVFAEQSLKKKRETSPASPGLSNLSDPSKCQFHTVQFDSAIPPQARAAHSSCGSSSSISHPFLLTIRKVPCVAFSWPPHSAPNGFQSII